MKLNENVISMDSDPKTHHEKPESPMRKKNKSLSSTAIIFCRIDPIRLVSGGDRYDSLLEEVTSGREDVYKFSLALRPRLEERGFNLSLRVIRAILPLLIARELKSMRKEVIESLGKQGIESPNLIWHFNTSKALYFIPAIKILQHKGDRCIGLTHHPMWLQFDGNRRNLYRALESEMLRILDRRIAASDYTRDLIHSMSGGKPVDLLPIPFTRSDIDSSVDDSNRRDNLLLYIGTIEPRKGLHLLLDAMRMLRREGMPTQLRIIGRPLDKKYYQFLKEIIAERHLDVIFEGVVHEERKRELLRIAKVFTFPSLAEGFGIVMVEAMQAGLPVVAFSNTAIPGVLGRGARGILCENKDAAAFATGIRRLLLEDELRQRLIANGRDFARTLPTRRDFIGGWDGIIDSMTSDVWIRPLQRSDAHTSVAWRNDPEVFKFTARRFPDKIFLKDELNWIDSVLKRDDQCRRAIMLDRNYIGNVYLTDIKEDCAEVHIFIGERDFWNKGIGTKAILLILAEGHRRLGINRVFAKVNPENTASLKMFASAGFITQNPALSHADGMITLTKEL